MTLSKEEEKTKLILGYIKSWAKDHKNPVPRIVLVNALTIHMNINEFRNRLKWLEKEGFIRRNNYQNVTYTLLKG